jgi:hypothetical protein
MQSFPRFEETLSGHLSGDRYVRPISPRLAALVAATPEGVHHANLAERWGQLRTRIAGLAEAVEKAKAADAEGERKAVAAGRRSSKRKAPDLEAELEEAREQLLTLQALLRESAYELLRASIAFLPEASEAADAAAEQALDEVRAALELARARVDEAGALAAESGWIGELAEFGHVHAWSGRAANPVPRTRQAIAQALAMFDEDKFVVSKRREEGERLREHAEQERLPPGTTIWKAGRTLRVGESGELDEVPS